MSKHFNAERRLQSRSLPDHRPRIVEHNAGLIAGGGQRVDLGTQLAISMASPTSQTPRTG